MDLAGRSLIVGAGGSITVIERVSSYPPLNPHFHTLFLDGVYASAQQPEGSDAASSAPLFHPAPKPTSGSSVSSRGPVFSGEGESTDWPEIPD